MGLGCWRVFVAFAAAARLAAQSSAFGAYATVSDTAIRVGNAELEVAFDRRNGGLDSLVHKKSGIDLRAIKTGTWPLLWGSRSDSLGRICISSVNLLCFAVQFGITAPVHGPGLFSPCIGAGADLGAPGNF